MPAEPLVDPATYRELEDTAGADFAAELAGTFFEEAPDMLRAMRQARDQGDADAFRRAAHSLKSNSLTFGAGDLARRARALELGTLAQADATTLDALQASYEATAAALRDLAHG